MHLAGHLSIDTRGLQLKTIVVMRRMPSSGQSLETPEGTGVAVQHRHHRWRIRFIMLAIATTVVIALLAWHFLLPGNSGMPGSLSERDKKEIAALLRGFTIRHGFQAFWKGEFRQCIRSLRISRQQRVNRFIDDQDGTFRVYTVVDSPKEKDGWYAWSRHVMTKTNGQWTILSSY